MCETQGEALPERTHVSHPRRHGQAPGQESLTLTLGALGPPSLISEAECHSRGSCSPTPAREAETVGSLDRCGKAGVAKPRGAFFVSLRLGSNSTFPYYVARRNQAVGTFNITTKKPQQLYRQYSLFKHILMFEKHFNQISKRDVCDRCAQPCPNGDCGY